jgi:hypothetical protein
MRTKSDLGPRSRGGRPRSRGGRPQPRKPRPPGGKALLRLFTYLGARDPALNNTVVATVAVAKAARPAYALTRQALQAKPVTAASAARGRGVAPAAKSFAVSITRAANALTRHRPARGARPARSAARKTKRTAPPPGPPGVWRGIGPGHIPNGQRPSQRNGGGPALPQAGPGAHLRDSEPRRVGDAGPVAPLRWRP